MGDASEERNELRSAMLDADADSEVIEHRGKRIEVRAPTLKQQKRLRAAAKDPKTKELDEVRMLVLAVIECAFVPGTDEKVFERADEDALMNQNLGPKSLVGKATKAIARLMATDEKDAMKEAEENLD